MRYPSAILSAAAAAVAMLRSVTVGSDPAVNDSEDAASPIPRLTARRVEQLAFAGASDAEIADRFLVDPSDIATRYREVLRVARALRRISLRGLQYDAAKKLNASMLTWLGKNELGQSLSPAKPGEAMPELAEE